MTGTAVAHSDAHRDALPAGTQPLPTPPVANLYCWPDWSRANPYQRLFHQAIGDSGIVCRGEATINDKWLIDRAGQIDILHFHWPEAIWRQRGKGAMERLRGVIGFERYLRTARKLGVKIVWTVHNLDPHEGATLADRFGVGRLAKHCDLLVSHSQWAASEIRRRWKPRAPVVVMPHGNYDGVYPAARPRSAVLAELGLDPDRPTVCFVGHLRTYKGIDTAIKAAEMKPADLQIIFAGSASPSVDASPLRTAAATQRGVRLIEGHIDDQLFADIVQASDAVLLPYKKITGSGALLAAWTLGRGVVASDLPYFREMAAVNSDAARLVPPDDPEALLRGIESYLSVPADRRSTAARGLADRFSWNEVVGPFVKAVQSLR